MKRALALMLAVVLVMSLGITAFAATDGKITVSNAINEVNYKLYKIFDATYKADSTDGDGDGTKDVVSYTLETTSPVYTYMFEGKTVVDGKIDNGTFTYEVATGVVTLNSGADAITYVTNMVRDRYYQNGMAHDACFVAEQTAANQKVEFTNLDYGYYVIDTAKEGDDLTKIAVTITTNTPQVEVIEKNQVPGQLEKNADKDSVSIGDTINWTVTFTATNYDGEKKVLNYTIKDTLSSEWATLNIGSITIKVGDDTLVKDTHWTLKNSSNTAFEIEIPWAEKDAEGNFVKFMYDPTEQVTITYSATVTENAASSDLSVDLKNKAELDWNYEGNGVGDGGDDDTDSDIHNMGFTKVDDKGNTLEGVKFELYKADGTTKVMLSGGANGVYTVDPESTSNEIVTPAGGQVVVMGLAEGIYKLVETETLDGYNKLGAPLTVEVGMGGADTITIDTTDDGVDNGTTYTLNNNKLNIVNNQGVELPSTGGKGTMMLITFGTMVAVAFAVLMITQKKMSIYND